MKSGNRFKNTIMNIVKSLALPVLVYFLFLFLSGGVFGTWNTIVVISKSVCEAVLLSWGMMIIMSSGMMDMSLGANALLSAMIGGSVALKFELGLAGMVIMIILCCVVVSAITGAIYMMLRLPSMIVTLGLLILYEALSIILTSGRGVSVTYEYQILSSAPYCYIIFLIFAALITFIMYFTKFGVHLNAVGSGPHVASNIGINVNKVRFMAFIVSGVFVGMSSVLILSNKGTISSMVNMSSLSYVFNSLLAVTIAQFISKYCGKVLATIIGTFTMKMLASGLLGMGISATWQNVCIGIFLLIFIAYSTNQQRFNDYLADKRRAAAINKKFLNENK